MKAEKVGVVSVVLASACCVGPLLLLALGLGGTVLGSFFSRYHWHLQIGSLIVLAVAWYKFLKERKKCRTAECDMKGEKMTRITLGIVTLIVAAFIGLNFVGALQSGASDKAVAVPQNVATVTIPVEGMTCMTCEMTVNKSLKNLPGVFNSNADSATGQVSVQYDPLKVSIQQMADAINKTGYKAKLKTSFP